MNRRIILTRGHGFNMGTFGSLHMPDGFGCVTVERPWQGNKVSQSCIPQGVYKMRQRNSEVVRRTTGGRYAKGWEVVGVPERTFIMFHPGNSIDDTEGCIMPGREFSAWDGKWTVTNSQDTFDKLMKVLGGADEWDLDVRYFFPEYP